MNEGLPISNIYDLDVSDDGYVWMASPVGLISFDGNAYTLYDHNNGLIDVLVNDVLIDHNDSIWVSMDIGGIAKLEGNQLKYSNVIPELADYAVNGIVNPSADEFWIMTAGMGIVIWNKATGEHEFISSEDGLPDNTVWDIYFGSENEVWIATADGVALYELENGITKVFTEDTGLSGYAVYQFQNDSEGNIWLATSNGLTVLNKNGIVRTITEVDGEPLDYVYSINKDKDNVFWIGTERKGIVLLDIEGNYQRIAKNNGLCGNYIYRIIRDKNDRMWVASDGYGICLIKDQFFRFYDNDSELDANSIFAIKEVEDGSIYITSNRGLSIYKNGQFNEVNIPERFVKYDEIWDIELLPDGSMLFLTYNYELFQFDGDQFITPEFTSLISDLYISDILVQNDGTIWLSSYGELVQIVGNDVTRFDAPDEYYLQVYLGTMFQDSRGILWITSEGGLAKFENGVFDVFDEDNGIASKSVHEVTEDLLGNLWIGTNQGIFYATAEAIENQNYQFSSFKDGDLYNPETVFLQFDANGDLWQGTNAGLNYFATGTENDLTNPLQLHFPLTDKGYGVEFNGPARLLSSEGELWFGTNEHGLIRLTPKLGQVGAFATEPPELFLRSIFANEDTVYQQGTKAIPEDLIVVDFDHRDLTFKFNGIDYLHPETIRYRYRLEGYDEDWIEAEDITEVRYTNLPAGTFNLQMASKSIKSDWGDVDNLVRIKIKKPFYLSIPFFVVIAMVFIGLVVAYINSRISRLEKIQLQKVVDQQTKDLREALHEKEVLIKEIHHRVKNNLAVISGLLELQGFKMPAGEAKLAIQESRMRVVAMSKIHENLYQNNDLANVDFRKFIQDLVKGIQQTMDLAEKNIEVVSYIDDVQLNVNVGVPLGMIINELISNAYKHAFKNKKEGSINITFKEQDGVFKLIVADDGVGTDANILNSRHKSLGISLVKSLCVQIGGYIEYETKSGAHFKLTLPKKSLT